MINEDASVPGEEVKVQDDCSIFPPQINMYDELVEKDGLPCAKKELQEKMIMLT